MGGANAGHMQLRFAALLVKTTFRGCDTLQVALLLFEAVFEVDKPVNCYAS